MNHIIKKILPLILVVLLMLLAIGAAADADVDVTVNAPPYVSEDTFEVTIDITEVSDLNGGQFDLTYDPDVIKVVDVEAGNIDDIEMPIVGERHFKDDDYDRYRVIFRLDGDDCASESGYVAKIIFEVVGGTGDTSAIDIAENTDKFKRKLSDCIGADEIPANWFGDNITIGTAPSTPAETPTPTPTEAPTIAAESAPEPTATPIETPSLELASNPTILTASAQSAPAAAVPDTPSENDGLQDLLKAQNFIAIYSLVGLLAFIYTLTLFK